MTRLKHVLRNALGAFSDGAVLFPLLALLGSRSGFATDRLLFTTGLAYVAAAAVFRVPMSVQPLKSIAVAAVTLGASFEEVRLSGLLLGLFCLGAVILRADRWSRRVPVAVIHQLQVGLGALLVLQGLKAGGGMVALGMAAFMVLLPEVAGVPVLGLVATGGLIYSAVAASGAGSAFSASALVAGAPAPAIRPELIAGLLLPQLVLTSANSVLATRDVCQRYFGARARRVTVRNLLLSIGLGNVLAAGMGGMPYCHGSGGVTAHARGGSNQAWSTGLMGILLLGFAAAAWARPGTPLSYPPALVTTLLIATGVFHVKMAAPTAARAYGQLKLACALAVTVLTRNLLWVLAVALVLETAPLLARIARPERISTRKAGIEP